MLLDTNLLVLLLVGKTRRGLIRTFKRTSEFTEEDYDALEDIVGKFQQVVTVPNVLTEVSNLCTGFLGNDSQRYLEAIIGHVNLIAEEYVPSKNVVSGGAFAHFGLTDAVLSEIAARHFLILTVDGALYHFLVSLGLPAINFNHIRTGYWESS